MWSPGGWESYFKATFNTWNANLWTSITFQIPWWQGRYIWKLIWWNTIIWFRFFRFSASKNDGTCQDTLSWKFSKMSLYPVEQNLTTRKKLRILWMLSSLENSFWIAFYQILGFACFIYLTTTRSRCETEGRRCLITARAACSTAEAILPPLSLVEYLVLSFGTLWSSGVERLLRPVPVMQKTIRIRSSDCPVLCSLFHQHQKQGVFCHLLGVVLMWKVCKRFGGKLVSYSTLPLKEGVLAQENELLGGVFSSGHSTFPAFSVWFVFFGMAGVWGAGFTVCFPRVVEVKALPVK